MYLKGVIGKSFSAIGHFDNEIQMDRLNTPKA
jgi:hypothetical protein